MIKRGLPVLFIVFSCLTVAAQERSLVKEMAISKTTRIKKAIYRIDAGEKPVIYIQGNNITIDFNNAELRGSNSIPNPDDFSGVAVIVRNCKNVTIKNLKASRYRVALLAWDVENLVLDNCDFSYNYRPHLNSSQEKEDISDWMSYHHNDNDEWLRKYAAAIYLGGCNFAVIRNCKVTGGQNALLMRECNDGMIVNNDFSFNSGIGIGIYRSNRNRVIHNRIIFNVRGYSHGVYNRGQDSAGLLVYEQSNDNVFYGNNVTHGGDGFFLWAGQTTMDKGTGGCNNNLISNNDFSYAPTNGIEVTFSSNAIYNNRMFECDHGIWGGYSYHTTIKGNQFRNNRIGLAIEHGQRNLITNNLFIDNKTAIRLWSNKLEPSDPIAIGWGYPRYRDTRSVAYNISVNSFHGNEMAFALSRSDSLWIHDNAIEGKLENHFKIDSTITNLDSIYGDFETGSKVKEFSPEHSPKNPFEGSGKFRGRKNIMITEWGPYDFRYPMIWNTNPTDKADKLKFKLIGPPGKWRIVGSRGITGISKSSGSFPDSIFVLKGKSDLTDIRIDVEFTGNTFIDQFGNKQDGNKPYRFFFKKYFKPINWEVRFFSLDTNSHNPIKTGSLFSPTERKAPVKIDTVNKVDYAWWGGLKTKDGQYRQFITIAEGNARFENGNYEVSVTWDDAVRVYIDDKLVIDKWNPSRYSFDESPHQKIKLSLGGEHQLRVEHLELGGFATLALKIKPVE